MYERSQLTKMLANNSASLYPPRQLVESHLALYDLVEHVEEANKRLCENEAALKASLERQSTMLAEALKEKNVALARCAEETNLKYAYIKRAEELVAELGRLQEELHKLKPPEPKFRVGQVVVREGVYHKITALQWLAYSCIYNYQLNNGSLWCLEEFLRALTDEEK